MLYNFRVMKISSLIFSILYTPIIMTVCNCCTVLSKYGFGMRENGIAIPTYLLIYRFMAIFQLRVQLQTVKCVAVGPTNVSATRIGIPRRKRTLFLPQKELRYNFSFPVSIKIPVLQRLHGRGGILQCIYVPGISASS